MLLASLPRRWPWQRRIFGFCLLLCMPLMATVASAATVLGIVSERSAAEVAAGAHALVEALPEHQVILRTPEQLELLSDEQVRALWQHADALFLAAVFGDQVGRLERLLRQHAPAAGTPILAMNSDRRVTRLTRLGGEAVLASLTDEQISEITANPWPGEDATEHLQKRRQAYPQQAEWLTGRAYYQGRSPEHIAGMLRWLLAEAGETLEVPAPQPRQVVRYYRGGKAVASAADLDLAKGPAVALLDLDYGDRPGDKQLLDALCQALEARKLQCFAVLARWGGASVQAVQT
jgi:cobaltochelatase CobN